MEVNIKIEICVDKIYNCNNVKNINISEIINKNSNIGIVFKNEHIKQITTLDTNNIDTNNIDTKDINTKDIDIKDADTKDDDIKDDNTNNIDTSNFNTNDIDTSNFNTNDIDIKDVDTKDNNTNNIDTSNFDTNDIDTKNEDANEVDINNNNNTQFKSDFFENNCEIKNIDEIIKTLTNTTPIEIAKLLKIIQSDNKDYDALINVGLILFSISCDENMFKIWCDWASVDLDDLVVLNNKWGNFTRTIEPNDWGLFNLRKYTKQRYSEEYNKYFKENVFERTKEMLIEGTPFDTAKFFYKLKPDNYIYQNGNWYYLNPYNLWKNMKKHDKDVIMSDISITIGNELDDFCDFLKKENEMTNDILQMVNKNNNADNSNNNLSIAIKDNVLSIANVEINNVLPNANNIQKTTNATNQKEKNIKLIELATKFKRKIRYCTFQRDIIQFSQTLYRKTQLEFDRNKTILPFENCLYDLEANTFRKFKPNDYVSMTTGYDWFEPKKEDVILVKDLLSKIQLDKDYRNCLLDIFCTCLNGLVTQSFIFYTGGGANGKSTINDIMLSALGDFGAVINAGILCKPIKAGGANSDFANMHLKRQLLAREPPEEKFCKSIIKELTGGKKINARNLYSTNDQTELNGTLGCELNGNPLFDGNITYAEVRRIILIKFLTRFTMNDADVNNVDVFKANPEYIQSSFHERIKTAFLTVLFEHNKLNFKGQITVPIKVRKDTDDLLLKGNDFLVWFDSEFEFIENPTVKDYTTIRSICDVLGKTLFYNSMTARQQNTLSEKSIKEMFVTHPLYSKYFSSGIDTTFEHARVKCGNCLKGCVKKIHDYL